MTMGVSETDTPEFLLMNNNAQRLYAKAYREGQFHTPEEKHLYAMQQVRTAINTNNGAVLRIRPTVSSDQSYALKRSTINSAISKGGGISVISKGMLPGTEADFKLLEAYAKDPSSGAIPPIYKVVAKDLNAVSRNSGSYYTDWDVANEQYKAVTGKELPKVPSHVERFRQLSPFSQKLMQFKGSSRANVQQVSIREKGNGNFNIEGAVLPGLQLEAVG